MKNNFFNFENTYTNLPAEFYTKVRPKKVSSPKLLMFNKDLCSELDFDITLFPSEHLANLLCGNQVPEGSSCIAQAYAGHQFGHFTMLGDGRAILLGEHNKNGQRFDIQFKGSGPTPYSRNGDGLAATGPMLREYLISEAMHSLNIPSCRSLAVVETGEEVIREKKYPGAILTRVSKSHIRIGTFQFAIIHENKNLLEQLFNYTIERHFPEIIGSKNKGIDFLYAVIEQQASLITSWMRVGFIHGVMNTDNVALSGETIDYGPCAFLDNYNPLTVFSSIDHQGRYAFANQPVISQWNLARLAETILPLININQEHAIKIAEEAINSFTELYQNKWLDMMRLKIGLSTRELRDKDLILDLLNIFEKNNADFTNTFRSLSESSLFDKEIFLSEEFNHWQSKWKARLKNESKTLEEIKKVMELNNPTVIPRNHIVEKALKNAEKGDLILFKELNKILKTPYISRKDINEDFLSPPKESEKVLQTFCGT